MNGEGFVRSNDFWVGSYAPHAQIIPGKLYFRFDGADINARITKIWMALQPLFEAKDLLRGTDGLLETIATKRARLDQLRPLAPEAVANLEHYYDIELTYTSNAIEGTRLAPVETMLVVEQRALLPGASCEGRFRPTALATGG
jgi:hypothetical protein